MDDNTYIPDSNLSFELIDANTNKKNAFFLTDFYAGVNPVSILKITAKTRTELYSNDGGNCNEFNYTFALIFPKSILDCTRLDAIRLLDDITEWGTFIKETETECYIYLLARTEKIVDSDGMEFLLQNLPVAFKPSSVTDVALVYRKSNDAVSQYCVKTWLDITNHSGINTPPFKLINDTPIVPIGDTSNIQLRLFNSTGKKLNLQKLRLQLQFDIYEDLLQSPDSLMHKTEVEKADFRIELYLKKKGNVEKRIASFDKSTATGQTLYRAMFDFNHNATSFDTLEQFDIEDQLLIKFNPFSTHKIPGVSPLTLNYFNITGYWDGSLSAAVKRTAYYENNDSLTVKGRLDVKGKLRENGTDLLPGGVIMIWSGNNIPAGWALCDGNNGTPDLRGKFVMGYSDKYPKGKQGGNTDAVIVRHTHSGRTENNGGHTHNFSLGAPQHNTGVEERSQGWPANGHNSFRTSDRNQQVYIHASTETSGVHNHTINIDYCGEEARDQNLPPYYTLAYIMKL